MGCIYRHHMIDYFSMQRTVRVKVHIKCMLSACVCKAMLHIPISSIFSSYNCQFMWITICQGRAIYRSQAPYKVIRESNDRLWLCLERVYKLIIIYANNWYKYSVNMQPVVMIVFWKYSRQFCTKCPSPITATIQLLSV